MTTTNPSFDGIAKRTLEYRATPDGPVKKATVRLGRQYFVSPPPGHEGEIWGHWAGPFQIEIDGEGIRSEQAEGTDGMQALHLAMFRAGLARERLYPGQVAIEGGRGGETGSLLHQLSWDDETKKSPAHSPFV